MLNKIYFRFKTFYLNYFLLFLITLDDIYSTSVGFAPFPIIGSFLFIIFNLSLVNFKVDKNIIFLIVLFSFYIIRQIFFFPELFFTPLVQFILVTLILIILLNISKLNKKFLIDALKIVITLHLIFFFYQFFYWVFVDEIIIFVNFFSNDFTSRHFGNIGLNYNGNLIPRFAGLYVEPGTYSSYIMSLLAVLIILEKKNSYLSILVCISVILSFSTMGFLLLTMYFFYFFSISLKEKKIIYILFLFILIIVSINLNIFNLQFDRIFNKHAILSNNDSIFERIQILYNYINYETFFFGVKKDELLIPVEDNTSFVTSYVIGGFLLFLLNSIIYIFSLINYKFRYFFLINIIFFAKLKWGYFIYWVLLSLILTSYDFKFKRKYRSK